MNSVPSSWRESKHVTSLFFILAIISAGQWPLHSTAAEGAISAGSDVTFIATADGSPAPTFQWRKNGTAIPGATTHLLYLSAVTAADAAVYQVVASNEVGSTVSADETLVVDATPTGANTPAGNLTQPGYDPLEPAGQENDAPLSGLVNLSVRAATDARSEGLIVGFVIDGFSSKSVLIRGVGPTLREFGVIGALSDPQLSLYSGALMTARNDDWNANESAAQIVQTSMRVGAFSLADTTSDSALMATLEHGAYTVHLNGKGSSAGVALVEVYDAAASGSNKLVNLSVRTYIGAGSDAPNVGFVVAGAAPRMVMIRAIGPTLKTFGVADSISDPQLELFRGDTRIDHNDNWGDATLTTLFAEVGAFALASKTSRDAVLQVSLAPGAYTVVVTGVSGSEGTGLVEVYDISR